MGLEEDEKEILEDFEKGEFVTVNNLSEELELAKQAVNNFTKRERTAQTNK